MRRQRHSCHWTATTTTKPASVQTAAMTMIRFLLPFALLLCHPADARILALQHIHCCARIHHGCRSMTGDVARTCAPSSSPQSPSFVDRWQPIRLRRCATTQLFAVNSEQLKDNKKDKNDNKQKKKKTHTKDKETDETAATKSSAKSGGSVAGNLMRTMFSSNDGADDAYDEDDDANGKASRKERRQKRKEEKEKKKTEKRKDKAKLKAARAQDGDNGADQGGDGANDDAVYGSNPVSIFWRKRRATKKRNEEQRLLVKLAQESPMSTIDSQYILSQALNTSNIMASVFNQADQDVSKIRNELNKQSDKSKSVRDQILLEQVRQRRTGQGALASGDAADSTKRIGAQKLADQRNRDRFEEQKRVEMEYEAKKRIRQEERRRQNKTSSSSSSSDTSKPPKSKTKRSNNKDRNGDDDYDDSTNDKSKRGNVLSATQSFVSNIFSSFQDDGGTEEWIVVCPKTRISPGEILPVTAAGLDLLLVASKDGSALHCIANSCPHLGTPLEVGTLERRPMESASPTGNMLSQTGTDDITNSDSIASSKDDIQMQEINIAKMLSNDGCEDCIVCPLHKTAFALESGQVRGEWCPYPPVLGKITGAVKPEAALAVFDVRARGKNIEVRLNSPVAADEKKKKKQ